MNQLAIIIPAYKIDFFERTLESFAKQSCKDFTLYIGDDCSSNDFKGLVEKYKEQLDIHYTRFKSNLGGKDLVAQWERCIDLSHDEPWLWLFSDDDELDSNCVESFYQARDQFPQASLFHYNVKCIDHKGVLCQEKRLKKKYYPDFMTAKEYAVNRLTYKVNSFVVEYVFKRDLFYEKDRFVNIDMAWGADDATWIRLASSCGITTITNSYVRWRSSGINITTIKDKDLSYRKLRAVNKLLCFENEQFKSSKMFKYYYWYFLHAIYNAMRVLDWQVVETEILSYRDTFWDIIPIWGWKCIYSFVNKLS